jgi:putative heme-binding domain-containing protein
LRFRAATALGRIGSPTAVPALLAGLDEQDLFARYAMFKALNRIGWTDRGAWPAILKGLESDKPAVRENTTYALRNAYDEALVTALATFVQDKTKSTAARSAALLSLAELHRSVKHWEGKWWGTQPAGSPRPPKVVEWAGTPIVLGTIRKALDDTDPALRLAAVEAMQIAPDPASADVLVALFRKDPSIEVRKSVLQALAAAKSPAAAPIVQEVLGNYESKKDLVPDAIALAEHVGGKPAVEALNRFVQTRPAAEAMVPALQAIGRLKDASSASVAAGQLRSEDVRVATAAAGALSRIGGKASVASLIEALSDKRPELRKAAVAGLGSLKSTEAVPALIKAHRDPQTKAEAVAALAAVPTIEALDVYLDAVGGKDAALREVSKKALAAIRDHARPLIEAKLEQGLISPSALAQIQSLYSSFEPVLRWTALGPFDKDAPPPLDPAKLETLPTSGEFKGPDGKPVTWRRVRSRDEHGMIDLAQAFDPNQNVAAYLAAEITSGTGREVEFHFGSDDRHAVWLNGEQIAADSGNSGWNHEEDRVHTKLKPGSNLLVVRCENDGGPWQFSASLSGERKGKLFEPIAAKKPGREAYAAYVLSKPGDAKKGEKLFRSDTLACSKCHQIGNQGGQIGPSLTGVGAKYDRAKLVESVLEPSKQIFDGYQQTIIRTRDDDVQAGVVRAETDAEVTLFDSAAQPHVIRKSDITSRKLSELSVMPEGLEQGMTQQELADLISFLESQKEVPK